MTYHTPAAQEQVHAMFVERDNEASAIAATSSTTPRNRSRSTNAATTTPTSINPNMGGLDDDDEDEEVKEDAYDMVYGDNDEPEDFSSPPLGSAASMMQNNQPNGNNHDHDDEKKERSAVPSSPVTIYNPSSPFAIWDLCALSGSMMLPRGMSRSLWSSLRPSLAFAANATDKWQRTPLHYACLTGNHTAARLLISLGCDIDIKDKKGCTPLMRAVEYGHPLIVIMLINAGAKLGIVNQTMESPLFIGMIQLNI
jgi:hypothetical protein